MHSFIKYLILKEKQNTSLISIILFSDFFVMIFLYFSNNGFRFAVFPFCAFAVCVLSTSVTTTGGCTSLSIETCYATTLSN
jgi:hypothetical protein